MIGGDGGGSIGLGSKEETKEETKEEDDEDNPFVTQQDAQWMDGW